MTLRAKHRRTLDAVFAHPVSGNIRWVEIETLVRALGGPIDKGSGARVHFLLMGHPATFHGPDRQPMADKGAVAAFRKYLIRAKISPKDQPR